MKLACLLHDVGYCRDSKNHTEASCQIAREFLTSINFEENTKEKIIEIVKNHAGSWSSQLRCPEGKILWTADKLDWVSPYGLSRAVVQNTNMESFTEVINVYVESVKKLEIDKVNDEKLKETLEKSWKTVDRFLKKLK